MVLRVKYRHIITSGRYLQMFHGPGAVHPLAFNAEIHLTLFSCDLLVNMVVYLYIDLAVVYIL